MWDVRRLGKKPLAAVSRHSKPITALAFANGTSRIVSAGMDRSPLPHAPLTRIPAQPTLHRHIKVYDVATYEVLHSRKASGPILSLAISVPVPEPPHGVLTDGW